MNAFKVEEKCEQFYCWQIEKRIAIISDIPFNILIISFFCFFLSKEQLILILTWLVCVSVCFIKNVSVLI